MHERAPLGAARCFVLAKPRLHFRNDARARPMDNHEISLSLSLSLQRHSPRLSIHSCHLILHPSFQPSGLPAFHQSPQPSIPPSFLLSLVQGTPPPSHPSPPPFSTAHPPCLKEQSRRSTLPPAHTQQNPMSLPRHPHSAPPRMSHMCRITSRRAMRHHQRQRLPHQPLLLLFLPCHHHHYLHPNPLKNTKNHQHRRTS